jgi:hypothetical protein
MTLGNMRALRMLIVLMMRFLRLLAVSLLAHAAVTGKPAHTENAHGSINTLDELFAALRKCWIPPPPARSHDGMEITVRFSLTREGKVFGKASIRYESREASEDERLAYRIAVAQAIERCTPFPITEGLGNAIAGHPLNIKFVDRRKQKEANATLSKSDDVLCCARGRRGAGAFGKLIGISLRQERPS